MVVIYHNIAGRTSLEYMNDKYRNDNVYCQEHLTKMREHMNDKYQNDAVYRQEHLDRVKERYRERISSQPIPLDDLRDLINDTIISTSL